MEAEPKYKDDDLIDLREIAALLIDSKRLIMIITLSFVLMSILYSIVTPNLYTSYALLSSSNTNNSLSSSIRNYSALAGLAGVNLPKDSEDKSLESIARIQSYNFFSNHFLPKIKLENLLAVKGWDKNKDKILYDLNKFEPTKNIWVHDYKSTPEFNSTFTAYEKYIESLSISQDQETLFVSISIKHVSPAIAQKWLRIIIHNINESMREEEKALTLKYIDFLNSSANNNKIIEIEKTILSLLKDQMQKLMLVSANNDYVFKQIEPPIIPENTSSLSVIVITIFGFIFGLISGIFTILIRNYFFSSISRT